MYPQREEVSDMPGSLKSESKMEDETELAISKIEALRKDTLRKAQV